ncbi:MAG: hypothetical protein HKM02_02140 [Pseudomonadales bacterium]|nr:hypothetical protein [Pseudomonadales bacterium]
MRIVSGRMPSQQQGYSLVELLVALTLGVFVVGGMLTTLLTVYQTSRSQSKVTTLSNNVTLAMNLLTQVIQSAGYIPDPSTGTVTLEFPATTTYLSVGQYLMGTYGGSAASDTLSLRYVTGLINGQILQQDSQINCLGRGLPSGVVANNPSTYYIFDQTLQMDANGNLTCTYTGSIFTPASQTTTVQEPTATYTLVGDGSTTVLNHLSFLYGVDTNADGSADGYYTATQVAALSDWSSVVSVQVNMVFNNPLASQAGQPATFTYSKIIPLMSRP